MTIPSSWRQDTEKHGADDPTTGELVARVTEDVRTLVRDELRLAQLEMTGKAKRAGIGAGLFGAAGLLALYGVAVLVAAAVIALALAVPAWLSALLVGLALLAGAGVAAVVGKGQVAEATPPVPEAALAGVKADIDAVKHHGAR
ncbi:phage holin family protein [Nocardioides caeni]|uniref:Phage holin family protein n=1 Tax=Nocardioides caeni TaxID=574700 RepID=A0A4S8NM24_9ACTN|nr:phage holin family protein [Nocardioides caeni]THV17908.1 phage holin family protein [Nocardioides caeni]